MRPSRRRLNQHFTVKLRDGADGYIIAECPEIQGCMSQGKDKEEALENIQDAIKGCLMVMIEDAVARAKPRGKKITYSDDELETLELKSLELVHA